MSDTALDHPLVRDYLRDLDRALAAGPAAQASELREQITAHLEDALPAGAADDEVAATLRRLGSPADLAAEAWPRRSPAWRTWARGLTRHGWTAIAAVAVLVAAAVAAGGYVLAYRHEALSAAPLELDTGMGWWYAQDRDHQTFAQADGAQQTSVPIRSGQEQGIAFDVVNPSSLPQTVLGPGPDAGAPGNLTSFQVGVSTTDPWHGGGNPMLLRFSGRELIPPHQIRWVRLMWISDACLSPGASQGIDSLPLRVRVGPVTRTETLSLDGGWYVVGPSHGHCS
jgi:hypothetical protein